MRPTELPLWLVFLGMLVVVAVNAMALAGSVWIVVTTLRWLGVL